MELMHLNEANKREGWDFEYITHNGVKIRYCIPVFYENGVATKILGKDGEYPFDVINHSMYVLGHGEFVFGEKSVYIYKNCTLDIEFAKKIIPYCSTTYKDKEPKKYVITLEE